MSRGANGNTIDAAGRLVTCAHRSRSVVRNAHDGSMETLADGYNGRRLNSPNDVAVKSDGSIWFTDPPYGLGDRIKEQRGNYVFRLDPRTRQLQAVIETIAWPNGICFSPDESKLYVANSDGSNPVIYSTPVKEDGTLGTPLALCRIDKGIPDGIRCDGEGRIWSSAGDGVHVFGPDGKLIGKILVPESPANLCFGGPEGTTLFITARTSLYAIRINARAPGLRQREGKGRAPAPSARAEDPWRSGNFRRTVSPPLVAPVERPQDPCFSMKDPTVVRHGDRWHLFCTIRSEKRSHQVEYLNFSDWKDANAAPRHVLKLSDGYFCAPQVFWFEPHRKWYMILQVSDLSRKVQLQPAFCTTGTIDDPDSWSKPTLLFKDAHPETVSAWIDFWVICDDRKAHLFFTSNNGLLWRAETPLANFPHGWSNPQVVLRGDIFEASCTYKLRGRDDYLTIVEAETSREGGWRYYKAYLGDSLEGEWKPLADKWERPFAGPVNVTFSADRWTDSISHGELIRSGYDHRLEVDPKDLRFLFQGVLEKDRRGKQYGRIPWRLGVLEMSGTR
jgi:sugar lactone lactonase YvrE